jgi:hypothetical protein
MKHIFYKLRESAIVLIGFLVLMTGNNLFGQTAGAPYGLFSREWKRLQQSAYSSPVYSTQYRLGSNVIFSNGGFETGDFTGWVVQDLTISFISLQVAAGGFDPGFGFFTSAPPEGSFSALHGFDGNGPGTIRVAQDVTVPTGALTLEFDYRAAWDLATFCNGCSGSRIFMVNIEPGGGGTALQSDTFLVADPNTQVFDTGDLHGTIDVSGFAGSSVRISFDWFVPEAFTGPGLFQFDNVFVIESGPQVSLSPNPVNFGNVGLGGTDTISASLRNIGTQDLTVSNISDPGGFFALSGLPSFPVVIPPGGSEMFEVSFAPPDSGTFTANLTVDSDDPDDPTLNVNVVGRGVLIGHNVELLANLNDYAHIGYSDCWGYTAPNGNEYALLGVHEGVSIVDVTNPAAIAEVDFVPFVPAPPFGWYDMKIYQNYMYTCSASSNGLKMC